MAERYRNFATVLYADSAPEDFKEIIESWHVPCLLSPYHDKDVNPTGEVKKPHWHLMIMFEGKKSREQVKALFDEVGGVGVEVVNSIRGYARYLCHMDNPEKAQYNCGDVIEFSSANLYEVITLETDKVQLIKEMKLFCLENDILSLAELSAYALIYKPNWERALDVNATYVMTAFIKSLAWEHEKGYQRKEIYTERGEEVNGIYG